MFQRFMFYILTVLALTNCAGNGSGSPESGAPATPAVEGNDFSGTYSLAGVECYSQTTYASTDVAVFSSYTDTLVITGNTYTSTSVSPGCSTVSSGKMVFNSDNTARISNIAYTSATGGSCNFVIQVAGSPANHLTPTSMSYVVTAGNTAPAFTTNWTRNGSSGAIALLSTFKTTNTNDVCLLIYSKQ